MTAPTVPLQVRWDVRRACANRGCPIAIVEYLDPVTGTRRCVHEHDGTPEADCAAAPFNPTDADVRESTDPELLRRVLAPLRVNLRQVMLALANPHCPPDLVATFRDRTRGYRSGSEWDPRSFYLAGLAARADNTPEDWAAMRTSGNTWVHAALAANPHAPRPVLDSLFRLRAREVRLGLARNPAVDLSTLLDRSMTAPAGARRTWQPVEVLTVALRARALTRDERITALERQFAAQPERDRTMNAPGRVAFLYNVLTWSRDLPGDVLDWIGHTLMDIANTEQEPGHPAPASPWIRQTLRRLLDPRQPVPTATLTWMYGRFADVIAAHPHWRTDWQRDMNAYILRHPNCDLTMLLTACADPNPDLRAAALMNPTCPEDGHIIAALVSRS